jgi:TPR repeat protein
MWRHKKLVLSGMLVVSASLFAIYQDSDTKAPFEKKLQDASSAEPTENPKLIAQQGRVPYLAAKQLRAELKQKQKSEDHGQSSDASDLEAAEKLYRENHYQEAFDQFRNLAEKGSPEAMRRLGNLYHFGEGVPQDFASAFEWYEKAFINGDDASPHHIGRLYLNGEGTERNEEEALYWYRHAALRGHVAGMSWMGYFYASGKGGLKPDRLMSAAWYSLIKTRDRSGALNQLYKDMPPFSVPEWTEIQQLMSGLEEEISRYRG